MKKIIIGLFSTAVLLASNPLPAALTVSAGLKGTYNSIPAAQRQYSPLIGAVVAQNGELTALYKEEGPVGDLARALFNELNGRMRCTVKVDDPASALAPRCIFLLLSQLHTKKTCADLMPEDNTPSVFKEQWLLAYQAWLEGLQKKEADVARNFRKNSKKSLAKIDAAAAHDLPKTQELLLAYSYLKCTTPAELQDFARLFYPALPRTVFTDAEFDEFSEFFKTTALTPASAQAHVEEMVFWLLKRKAGQLDFLKPPLQYVTQNKTRIPLCVEGALQTVVNCLLYNENTKLLTLDMLPPSVGQSLNPDFKAFVMTHSNPDMHQYYTTTLHEWAQLLTNIPNVVYKTGNQEIKADSLNILTTLNFLFGTDAKSFKKFSEIISSEARTLTIVPLDLNEDENDMMDAFLPGQLPAIGFTYASDDEEQDSENGDSDDDDDSDNDEDNDNEEGDIAGYDPTKKEYLKLSFTGTDFTTVLKLAIVPGHSEANFMNKSSTFVPTVTELDNLTLVGNLIGHNLLTLFNVDWYKTILTLHKQKVFTTGQELLHFLRKYPVTAEELSAPSRYDSSDYLLDDYVRAGNKDFVEALIKFGLDANSRPEDNILYSPLYIALHSPKSCKAGIPQLLLENGAQFDVKEINEPSESGWKIIDSAILNQDLYSTNLLLELGADPNLVDPMGTPSLLTAVRMKNQSIISALLRHGANPNACDAHGYSPLSWASSVEPNEQSVKLLLENGANPNTYDSNDTPLLLLAAVKKDPTMIRLFLEHGADPRLTTKPSEAFHQSSSVLSYITSWVPEVAQLAQEKAAEFDRKEKEAAQAIKQKVQELEMEL